MESAGIDLELDLDLDSNFEPQSRARSNTWPLRPPREEEPQSSPVGGADDSGNGADAHLGKDPLGLTAKKSGSRRNAWGNLSYADLITKAIQSSPENRLTLSQIYDWMVQNVPYFKGKGDSTSSAGWKNSIRHNLSLHNRFMRIQNEGTGKSSWWVLNPDAKPGKAPRRRAGSMETKSYEKKRGRVRKKVEALRAMENGGLAGTLSPGGSEDYLDSLSFGDFRPRASSNASSCGRLSPIHAAAEPDLHDNQVPPMSPIPWGREVSNSPTIYGGDGSYSDLIDSLGVGMKLSNQDNMVTGLSDPYLSASSSQQSNFLGVESGSDSVNNQYQHLPAPPPYPKAGQQHTQLNGLEFSRQNLHSALRLQQQIRAGQANPQLNINTNSEAGLNAGNSSPYRQAPSIDLYGEDYRGLQQDSGGLSPGLGQGSSPNSLSVNTQQPNLVSSPDQPQQGSPGLQQQCSQLSLSPLNCQQLSPQQTRHLLQQLPNPSAPQQQQLQAVAQAPILREALTRGPLAFRSHTAGNASSPSFSPQGNLSPQGSMSPLNANNLVQQCSNTLMNGNGMRSPLSMGSNMGLTGQLRNADQLGYVDNASEALSAYGCNPGSGMSNNINNATGDPLDIDMDLISDIDYHYDVDQVIKQELTLEGNLDFNFEQGPGASVGQNAVH